ncbi:MAG: type II toxin-antitoxin system HicB family antitoxin [Planctomycetes bacterium]|nr:type II toxin-antitoxin system HicB family antitoxin [Planctomycetota bacterium]
MSMRYQIILRPEPEGGYTVLVPALPGCVTWGKTLQEARKMAADAIEGYLVSLLKHGEAVPADDEYLSATVDVELPAESLGG